MATTSDWRLRARRVIATVLANLPEDVDPEIKRRAVREAYPFGERAYHPYKCWLAEVRLALKPPPKPIPASGWRVYRNADLSPPYQFRVDYWCSWCERNVETRGCVVCGPEVDRLSALLASQDFMALLSGLRAVPHDVARCGLLADWLDEHEYPELAAQFRELTTEASR